MIFYFVYDALVDADIQR